MTGWFIRESWILGSSVVVVTILRAGRTGHYVTIRARPVWEDSHARFRPLPGALLPAVKRLWREGYSLFPLSVGIKK
jgi:hypothetical protein